MTTDQTLARIDATLEDYDQWDGNSPDAARWAGGPTEGEWSDRPTLEEAWRRIVDYVIHFSDVFERLGDGAFQGVAGRQCWKCRRWHYGERMRCDTCWPKQLPRPMAAAERTSSPRRRAGSRRTKRQARRRG